MLEYYAPACAQIQKIALHPTAFDTASFWGSFYFSSNSMMYVSLSILVNNGLWGPYLPPPIWHAEIVIDKHFLVSRVLGCNFIAPTAARLGQIYHLAIYINYSRAIAITSEFISSTAENFMRWLFAIFVEMKATVPATLRQPKSETLKCLFLFIVFGRAQLMSLHARVNNSICHKLLLSCGSLRSHIGIISVEDQV